MHFGGAQNCFWEGFPLNHQGVSFGGLENQTPFSGHPEATHEAVGQNQWYHFGVGAPPILVYFSGDWDVHWGYDSDLTHGQESTCEAVTLPRLKFRRAFGGLACLVRMTPVTSRLFLRGNEGMKQPINLVAPRRGNPTDHPLGKPSIHLTGLS